VTVDTQVQPEVEKVAVHRSWARSAYRKSVSAAAVGAFIDREATPFTASMPVSPIATQDGPILLEYVVDQVVVVAHFGCRTNHQLRRWASFSWDHFASHWANISKWRQAGSPMLLSKTHTESGISIRMPQWPDE
jgi:hypothetical protein